MKNHPPAGATARSRDLRSNPTDAEQAMWRLLREGFGAWRFRRQVPIRQYIVDFASHRGRLVVEVDGGQHSVEADAQRTAIIETEGYRVVRFWNHELHGNPDGVWAVIDGAVRTHHPHPTLPHQGGGL